MRVRKLFHRLNVGQMASQIRVVGDVGQLVGRKHNYHVDSSNIYYTNRCTCMMCAKVIPFEGAY